MSVPSMEELVETFAKAHRAAPWASERALFEAGLLAVLDRLKPVVAEAWIEGRLHRVADNIGTANPDTAYATRIIDQIKGT